MDPLSPEIFYKQAHDYQPWSSRPQNTKMSEEHRHARTTKDRKRRVERCIKLLKLFEKAFELVVLFGLVVSPHPP